MYITPTFNGSLLYFYITERNNAITETFTLDAAANTEEKQQKMLNHIHYLIIIIIFMNNQPLF